MSWQISSIWRDLRHSRLSMVSLVFLTLLMLVALLADLIASDLPLLLRLRGETYVLPAVVRPAALRQFDNQQLRQLLDNDPQAGWAWMPLCEYGPEQQPQILRPPPCITGWCPLAGNG